MENHRDEIIGIVGDSVYANQLLQAFLKMGHKVYQFSRSRTAADYFVEPDHLVVGSYDQYEQLQDFSEKCDRLVIATEEISVQLIERLSGEVNIMPVTELLSLVQDRLLFKTFLEAYNFNAAPYATITTKDDARTAVKKIGYPAVLKDNFKRLDSSRSPEKIEDEEELEETLKDFQVGTSVMEAWVPHEREVVVEVGKDQSGTISLIDFNEIVCDMQAVSSNLVAPPRISHEVAVECQEVAASLAELIHYVGVMTIELLVTSAGVVYIHDVALVPKSEGLFTEAVHIATSIGKEAQLLQGKDHIHPYDPSTEHVIWRPVYRRELSRVQSLVADKGQWKLQFVRRKWQNAEPTALIGYLFIQTTDTDEALSLLNELHIN